MMNGFVGMLLANENTSKSLDGLGALKGAPCILESIKDLLTILMKFVFTAFIKRIYHFYQSLIILFLFFD